ncbi:MAG: superoxide dismutase [Candidatus Melainabacteria bacterium]|jgi:Fe-Mn family superoxide dismutase
METNHSNQANSSNYSNSQNLNSLNKDSEKVDLIKSDTSTLLSRRDLLKMSSALFAGQILTNSFSNSNAKAETTATTKTDEKNSNKTWWTTGPIKTKDFSPLVSEPPNGMSSRQISEHLGLYKKYVISLNKVTDQEKAQGISHDTLVNKGFAYGGTILHELYFGNMSSNPPQLNYQSELMKAIERQYGAYEGLLTNFKEAGKAARGWAILGLNLFDGRLNIYGMDAHNEGSALAFIWPVIVMDVYEHAYMIDHGTNKEAYIDSFLKNIDWSIGEARFLQGMKNISNTVLII